MKFLFHQTFSLHWWRHQHWFVLRLHGCFFLTENFIEKSQNTLVSYHISPSQYWIKQFYFLHQVYSELVTELILNRKGRFKKTVKKKPGWPLGLPPPPLPRSGQENVKKISQFFLTLPLLRNCESLWQQIHLMARTQPSGWCKCAKWSEPPSQAVLQSVQV